MLDLQYAAAQRTTRPDVDCEATGGMYVHNYIYICVSICIYWKRGIYCQPMEPIKSPKTKIASSLIPCCTTNNIVTINFFIVRIAVCCTTTIKTSNMHACICMYLKASQMYNYVPRYVRRALLCLVFVLLLLLLMLIVSIAVAYYYYYFFFHSFTFALYKQEQAEAENHLQSSALAKMRSALRSLCGSSGFGQPTDPLSVQSTNKSA